MDDDDLGARGSRARARGLGAVIGDDRVGGFSGGNYLHCGAVGLQPRGAGGGRAASVREHEEGARVGAADGALRVRGGPAGARGQAGRGREAGAGDAPEGGRLRGGRASGGLPDSRELCRGGARGEDADAASAGSQRLLCSHCSNLGRTRRVASRFRGEDEDADRGSEEDGAGQEHLGD